MQVEDSVLKEDVEDVENVEDKKSVPIVTVFETDKYKEQDQKKKVLMEGFGLLFFLFLIIKVAKLVIVKTYYKIKFIRALHNF